jgi:uncharacterized protein (TIGR03437 family)
MKRKYRFTFLKIALLGMLACAVPTALESAHAQIVRQSQDKDQGIPEGYTIVEGDIQMPIEVVKALRNRKNDKTNAPQATFRTRLWPNGVIPFEFDGADGNNCPMGSTTCVNTANRSVMLGAMGIVQTGANIRFQQCSNNSCGGDFVHIQANPTFNNSAVGRQGGRQIINIVSWGDQFIIAHELMHCLGMYHEQSRPDRNNFVTINTGNVQAGLANNFDLESGALAYGAYDFDSLMHYAQCDFSVGCGTDASGNPIQSCNSCPGRETITVNEPFKTQWQSAIGQRTHLSDMDRLTLRLLYAYPNWRFVDGRYTGQQGASDGTFLRPYQSLAMGINATPVGGALWIQPGAYFANSLTKAISFQAPLGGVNIRALQGAAGETMATFSAASYNGELASESIAVAFGENLSSGTASAASLPLPTTLGGVTVKIKDSAEVEREAPLFFVSPGQINYLVPAGASVGPASVTIYKDGSLIAGGLIPMTASAPGVFTADSSGLGAPAALVLRVRGEEQTLEPVSQYDGTLQRFVPAPIDLGPESDQVFLILFGTGFRSSPVSVMIGEDNAEVPFSGGLAGLAGLDQANVRLSRSLAGKGDVRVLLTADNRSANPVTINIR